jgi:transcriptional regulator with XRE-family HTH domain
MRIMKSIHDQAYRLLIGMLKEIRKKQKVTQAEMAERIGSDQTYVSKVETMERRIDVIEVRSMCKALGIDFLRFIKDFEERLQDKGTT